MSELDNAMEEEMAYLVIHESQPFCYRDFLWWDDGEKEWGMQHNTFRNKISKLRKAGKAKFCYYSSCAFYTLEGYPFKKSVTPYPYGGLPFSLSNNDPLYKTLANLPFGAESVHDIRLRFQAPDIYNSFSLSGLNYPRNSTSQDILIPSFSKDNAIVRIIVHRTDVVSVIIGCSKQPIPLDPEGLIRFSTLLTRAEDTLQFILSSLMQKQNYNQTAGVSEVLLPPTEVIKIPDYKSWFITMWHFGRDALVEYNGEKFTRTIEDAQHILTRIYSKEYGNGRGKRKRTRIRQETQEYPNITVEDAINEKLSESELEQEASSSNV